MASRWAAVAILGLAAGLLALHLFYYARLIGFDPVDDAYISFRYAANWAQGFGPVFNPGERVEGYTNFLWTATLAGVDRLGLSMPPASIVLGALLALGTLALLWTACRRGRSGAEPLALFLLAADGSFALWAVSGLETALFSFLVLAGALALAHELEEGGFPFSGLLFALAAMTRPEGVLVFGLSAIYQILFRLLRERRLLTAGDLGRAALFCGLFGGYFLWRYRFYGYLLPNTFYAKVELESPDAQIARGGAHLQTFLRVHGGLLLPALIALPFVAALVRRVRGRGSAAESAGEPARHVLPPGYLLLLVVAYGAYIVYVGGDWSIGRFFVPILPFAYLLAAQGLGLVLGLARRAFGGRGAALPAWGLLLVAAPLALALAYLSSYRGERELYALPFEVRLASQARQAAGRWLRRNAPRDALLLVDAAGQMPYYSGLRSIDLFGLTDVYVAHKRMTIGKGTAGHEKVDLDYLFGRKPDYIVIYGAAFDAYPQLYSRVRGWTTDPAFDRFLSIYRRAGEG